MAYRVTAPVVLAKVETTDGIQYRYFNVDAILPETTLQESIDHLLSIPMIEAVDDGSSPVKKAPAKADA